MVQIREYIDPTIGVVTLPDATFTLTCMAGAIIKMYRGIATKSHPGSTVIPFTMTEKVSASLALPPS